MRVLSATENIDTFNENDDLIIGFKGLVNDFYARDGSRRVRTGYRQKQKEGIVTIPPFGYFKDKNTKKVVVVEEAAETVRMIFSAYTGGSGMKYDRIPSGGVGNRADRLFSLLTGTWAKGNRPQAQCAGTKDASTTPGGAMRQRSLCGKQSQ